MDALQYLMQGFGTALQPQNLLFAFIGALVGTAVGVLPGIGPAAATAMLLPATFTLPPTPAIIMLAAIYYGAMYGGTLTSILVNVPGESSSVVTCFEGHEMAKRGRAGPALSIAAIGSFMGGSVATLLLVVVAMPLARLALQFGPTDLFALMCLGISFVMGMAGKSTSKALMSGLLGLIVGLVGMDPVVGQPRFSFGHSELVGGIELVAIVMGLFGVSDVLLSAESPSHGVIDQKIKSLMPTREDWGRALPAIGRGTIIGGALGLIPGIGSIAPPFIAFVVEKKVVFNPKEGWGRGVIEGVASPETANNAYANAALIPLFTLGIPGSPTIAILMGAFIINGLIPGPFLFTEHADIAWAVIASLYIGNLMLLVLNLPLIRLWIQILKVPTGVLWALILSFCVIGAYSLNNRTWDVGVMLAFGILGYLMTKLEYPLGPFTLTLVLGPLMEQNMAKALMISGGDVSVFFTRPVAVVLLAISVVFLVASGLGALPLGTAAVREDVQA